MAEVRIKDIDEHEIDTILAEDIDFEGQLTFKKPLMIKGRFRGEIKSTSALYIGEKALVEATTEAAIVSSKGAHKGDIVGHSRVELFSTAQVDGDITTPDFVMESGCKFNGYCNMGGGPRPAAGTSHAAQQSPQKPSAPVSGQQPVGGPGNGPQAPGAPSQAPQVQQGQQPPGQQPTGQQGMHQQGPHQQGGQQNRPGTPPTTGGQQR